MKDDKKKFAIISAYGGNPCRGSAEERPLVAPIALPLFLPSYGESVSTRLQFFFVYWGGLK